MALGWDSAEGQAVDLNLLVFCLGGDGHMLNSRDRVYHRNPSTRCGDVVLLKSSTDGAGEGEDEAALVQLCGLRREIQEVVLVIQVETKRRRGHTFAHVRDGCVGPAPVPADLGAHRALCCERWAILDRFPPIAKVTAVTTVFPDRYCPGSHSVQKLRK